MGVHGLWRLIEPSGKPVPLETLENKVLAVDVSIWLHQAIRGFQDSKGAPVPNAHLLGIYHRVCKLLYFKIKPIFVFDGGVPALKKQTIAKRNQLKSRNSSDADRLQKQLLTTLMKHSAISKVLSEKAKSSITAQSKKTSKNDLFELPKSELDSTVSSSDDEENSTTETDTTDSSPTKHWDLHTIDMNSSKFKSLPVDIRHEILTELKETRKQSSWGRIHEIPTQSDDFSSYQMKRLLQRQAVQAALEEAAQEMGGASLSLAELESLLKDQGVPTTNDVGQRIASDENTRYLYIKDVKEAIARARREQNEMEAIVEDAEEEPESHDNASVIPQTTRAELEEAEDLEKAIALSLQDAPSTSKNPNANRKFQFSFLEGFNDGDFQSESSEDELEVPQNKKVLSSAASYMMEYSGLTPNEIQRIIGEKSGKVNTKSKTLSVKDIKSNKDEKRAKQDDRSEVIVIEDIKSDTSAKGIAESHIDYESQKKKKEVIVTDDNKIESERRIVSESFEFAKDDIKHVEDDLKKVEVVNTSDSSSSFRIEDEKRISQTFIEEVNKEVDETSSSDSDDLMEVCDDPESPKKLEIKIDPSKPIDDDLFSDIFEKTDTKATVPMEINIDPQKKVDDDLFADIFKEEDMKDTNLKTAEVGTTEIPIIEEKASVEDVIVKSSQIQKTDDNDSNLLGNELKVQAIPQLSIQEMETLKDNLQREKIDIIVEKSSKERLASNITDQMYKEAQELLELFGVPYIIAPMEAEAQCAFLDAIDLTDGTITDDSDIWLFGGRTVYKNFFNQTKYVMEFNADNIKHHFKLSREQMILLALLVGSDYTTGIQGIGPVTALEILSAFPPNLSTEFSLSHTQLLTGLRDFKAWFNKGKTGGLGRTALKNKLTNITFSESFPSLQVVEAYLQPTVETSDEKFSWAKPDILALTVFARDKFGWSSKKTDEILKPVIKKLEESLNQKSIKDFFRARTIVHSANIEGKISKRVKSALDRFGKTEDELIAEEMLELEKEKKIRKRTKKQTKHCIEGNTKEEDVTMDSCPEVHACEENEPNKKRVRREKKKIDSATKDSERDKNTGNHNTRKRTKKQTEVNEKTELGEKIGRDADSENNLCEERVQTIPSCENTEVSVDSATKPSRCLRNNKKPIIVKGQKDVGDSVKNKRAGMEKTVSQTQEEPVDELKLYSNLAAELKLRRKRQNELKETSDKKTGPKWKKRKPKPIENIPEELKQDEDIQMLIASTSKSATKVEHINKEIEEEFKKTTIIPDVKNIMPKSKNEVIHQRLRDKSNHLKNKLKAIEVYRKSRKGPGYVEKRQKRRMLPKDDAGLSEDSD